jgi:Glucosidase II beta subunit-like protein/Glucosidase II beta subunit-like
MYLLLVVVRPAFVCPQQPAKALSASKLHDGICDCCCGSDELSGDCPDVCDQVLADERKKRQQLQTQYVKGKTVRAQRLAEFQHKRSEVAHQLDQKNEQLKHLQEQVHEVRRHVRKSKGKVWHARHRRVVQQSLPITRATSPENDDAGSSTLSGMFQPLTAPELVDFIVHACQMAGEIMAGDSDTNAAKTCLPLRLAGLDLGLVWRHSTYQVARISENMEDDEVAVLVGQLAEMLHLNAQEDRTRVVYNEHALKKRMPESDGAGGGEGTARRNKPNSKSDRRNSMHRRLQSEDDYDDEDEEYLMASGDDPNDDDMVAHGHHDRASHNGRAANDPSKSSSDDDDDDDDNSDEALKEQKKSRKEASEQFAAELRQRPLGSAQHKFLEKSQAVLDRMNAILDDMKRKDEKEKSQEREKRRKETERRRKQRAKDQNKDEGDEGSHDVDDDDTDSGMDPPDTVVAPKEGGEDGSASQLSESLPENFDPVALPLARDALVRRQAQVHRGYQYAVSAKILLDALLESDLYNDDQDDRADRIHLDLSLLAVGTLAHSKISAVQTWQIYQGVVDEFLEESRSLASQQGGGGDDDDQTCKSPWTALCPPRSIVRVVEVDNQDVPVKIPPEAIHRAAAAFCDEQMALLASSAESCLSSALTAAELPLPSTIPDGYLGYAAPTPRHDDDVLSRALAALDLSYSDDAKKELEQHLEREKLLTSDQQRVQDEIRELTDSIGYDDPTKYGDNGELFAHKDECFSYDTGKYVYEICLHGESKQKEGKNSGGTDLGRWTGASVDEATGRRVWKWENGQRCWNGPNRSATAYVTCGTKTRVLSVEEPEICKYELQVESYIGCDEAFRAANNLDEA